MAKFLKTKAINKQKNKVRGLIAKARSNAFKKGFSIDPSYVYCQGIKEIYLDSRTKLLSHEFSPFLNWVDEQNRTVAFDLLASKPRYADLAGVISSGISRGDLEAELLWVTHLLTNQSPKINDFVDFNTKLENLILAEKINEAINLIETFDNRHGSSFYTHEIRIALENLSGGLEQQKSYVAKVRSNVNGGLLGFLSYYISIRNENKTTISKFKEDLNLRLEKHKYYDETIKHYLRYKLAGEIEENKECLADIIFVEQSHHIFDLYNTYLAILQKVVQGSNVDLFKTFLIYCCNHLECINDPKIKRIKNKLDNAFLTLPNRNIKISDELLSGNVRNSIRAWNSMSITDKSDPWQFIYFGFTLSQIDSIKIKHNIQSPLYVPHLISKIATPSEKNSKLYLDKIKKILLNFPCLNFLNGVYEFADQILNKNPCDVYNFDKIGFSSKFHGIEDNQEGDLKIFLNSTTSDVWNLSRNVNHKSTSNIPQNVYNTFKAISMINSGNYQDTVDLILSMGRASYGTLWPINLSFLLSSYFNAHDTNRIVRAITTEGVKSKKSFPIHSIEKFLNSHNWMAYKNIDDPILTCVAIHLLWKHNDNAEVASMLRYSIRQCLRNKKIKLPSELIKLKRTTSLRVWKYFFREVCRNQFIDQLVQGSNSLLLERQKICAHMSNIDYDFTDCYENEMADIASSLAIDNGKKFIDRTRIHVDADSLTRWASKELIEDYRRYHDLLDVNVKASFENEFNEIFSDILKKGGNATKWKSLNKDSEADMVFISLIARLSDEFLNSPEYGLDFYLSKRVRHQSFIGLIRGPLEFGNLITTKESSGEYNSNEFVLSRLSSLPEENLKYIDSELKKFAKKFDDLLESTKNSYFQIYGTDNPKGLIKLEIQEQAFFLLKMMTHKVKNFTDFIDFAISVFWASLSIPLSNVRQYISQNLKQAIVTLFDELTMNLKKSLSFSSTEVHRLIHDIKNCSIEVQRELDFAAQWFSRGNIEDITQSTFDANQILDIAIESTLKCHQSFHPNIKKNVINNNDMLLDTISLVFVHDVMFVALGNIFRHSGLKNPNVLVTTEITDETYSISVESGFSTKNIQHTLEKLTEIRNLIKERKFERRTRKEGGSGLLKIAAAALQDPLGKIEFNVIDESFVLNVTSRLFMASLSLEGDHG